MKGLKAFRRVFSALFLSTLLAITNVSGFASAVETEPYRMRVSPAKAELGELIPGKTYTGTFTVENTGSSKIGYKATPSSYTVSDELYTSDFEHATDYNHIIDWVTVSPESGNLEPGEKAEVSYTVKVPNNAPSGGQYAAILIQMIEPESEAAGTAVTATKQIGFVLYSTVSGETVKSAKVTNNKIPSIRFNPPIIASATVENTGNVHISASYVLQVYSLFGGEEIYSNEDHPTEMVILPETSRLSTQTWDNAPHLGIFRVKQTVSVLDEKSITEKIVFLCPVWLLFVLLLLIFCIIFWIATRIKTRK